MGEVKEGAHEDDEVELVAIRLEVDTNVALEEEQADLHVSVAAGKIHGGAS